MQLQLVLRLLDILSHWRCRTGELQLANVGRFHPISDTQNKQGSSPRGNLSHWIQTSVHFVHKGPLAAACQTTLASNPNKQ